MLYLCILTHTVIQPFAARVWKLNDDYDYYYYYYY